MTRFRKQDRQSNQADLAEQEPTVFLIEDSIALGILLKNRIEEVSPANVQLYRTLAHATAALQENRPTLAITGLNLPDAPDGEMLDVLTEYGVPTILFTATFDRKVRERFASAKLVDYFVKDTVDAVDQLVRTVVRLTGAGSTAILVVDDTLSVRAALVDLLQRQKYQVFDAGSGTDALKILSANPQIRLVITDFHMPDMDGQQLTREIRQTYSTEDLRVIGVSSSSDPSSRPPCSRRGRRTSSTAPISPRKCSAASKTTSTRSSR
jgi:PleD family two-component response regulator